MYQTKREVNMIEQIPFLLLMAPSILGILLLAVTA
jgi:hypothetical protein